MGFFKVFHTPKPRQFYHRPIYYNPEEEERKEREERLGLKPKDGEFHTSIQRGSFRKQRWDAPEETREMRRERKNSNVRLIAILLVLFGIAAFIYFTT